MSEILPVKFDQGQGEVVVLLHGLGNNYQSWSFVLEHLDYTKQRVIVFDLLGFGDAPKPSLAYTPADHAKAVIATLDRLKLSKVTLAGHSMGCLVAIELASSYPDRVQKLALFGAPLYKAKPRHNWWRKLTRTEGLYFAAFQAVKRLPETIQTGSEIADDLLPFIKGMEITEATWPAYRKSLENTIMQLDSYQQVLKLQTPTLFINGWFDLFIIRHNIRAARRGNKSFVRVKRTLGPHELTPRQGRTCAKIIARL